MGFKVYGASLPIRLRWYDLPLGTICTGDLSVALSRGEKHGVCDTIRLYKDKMREIRWSLAILLRVY